MTRPSPAPVYWRSTGDGQPLVLVNGWSASGLAWPRAWIRQLRERFRVIRIDNRGTGWSRFASTPFTMADLADDVISVLDDAAAPRAIVFGLSMGGMIAQETALRAPQRIAGLVLAATAPPMPAYRPTTSFFAAALLRPPGRRQTLEDYFRGLWSQAVARGFVDAHPEVIEELVAQILARPTPRSMLVHQLRAVLGWGHASRLATIASPTVVLHGREDRFIDVSAGRRLSELIPGSRFVELDGVGHLVACEAPKAAADAIDEVSRRALSAV